jgi:hypothetical protein
MCCVIASTLCGLMAYMRAVQFPDAWMHRATGLATTYGVRLACIVFIPICDSSPDWFLYIFLFS